MAFYETPRFPDAIAFGATGGPEFDTEVVRTMSREFRDGGRRKYPMHRYDVAPAVKTEALLGDVCAFFWSMQGRLHAFRFRDRWDNNTAFGGGSGVVTGITSTTFQLVKRYAIGAVSADRVIKKPVAEGLEVRVSGSPISAWTLDTTTGVLTIAAAPAANTVTWSGSFDVPCRFDTDRLELTSIARTPEGLILNCPSIQLVEVPL